MAEQIFRTRVSVTDTTNGAGTITIEGPTERHVELATKILCTTNEGTALFSNMRLMARNLTAGGYVTARWEHAS